jgi:hypothetical protein
MRQNLISKSIGDNFKIAAFLFYEVYAKKSHFFGYFVQIYYKVNKQQSI